MTIDSSATPDTGADDTVDTSSSGETAEIDAAAPANDNSAGGETAAEKRLRLKWRGIEEEVDDPRKLAERFSDEYEFEFRGPGGKPVKQRWFDIERAVQKEAGAQERMKQANAIREQYQAKVAWARENNFANLPALLEQEFGLEDAEEFFYQRAAERIQREQKLMALYQEDPVAHHRELMRMHSEKMASRQKWAEQQRQQQERAQQTQAQRQQREQALRLELKSAGVPANEHTIARAAWIARQNQELGIELEPRQLAYELRKQLDAERLEFLDSLAPEKLLQYLGEGRRAKLREAELAATKAAQKQARAAAPPKKPASNGHDAGGNQVQPKSVTDMLRGGWKS